MNDEGNFEQPDIHAEFVPVPAVQIEFVPVRRIDLRNRGNVPRAARPVRRSTRDSSRH